MNDKINQQQFEKIIACFKTRKLKLNTLLLHEGEVCDALYYVRKGSIRTFFIDASGAEKTSCVTTEGNFGTAWTSFIAQQPSREHIEMAEHTELLYISYRAFQNRVKLEPYWKNFYLKCLESAYLNQFRKVEALMTLDAKGRYLKLLDGNPELIRKLSNRTLASFLAIREETLSRVKGKK